MNREKSSSGFVMIYGCMTAPPPFSEANQSFRFSSRPALKRVTTSLDLQSSQALVGNEINRDLDPDFYIRKSTLMTHCYRLVK